MKALNERGVCYSRYVDDVTLSSAQHLSPAEKSEVIRLIYDAFRKKGLRPKRKKHTIEQKGSRIRVNGLIVNGARPRLPRKKRDALRAAVLECEQLAAASGRVGDTYSAMHRRVAGRVGLLRRLQDPLYARLRERLERIRPVASA